MKLQLIASPAEEWKTRLKPADHFQKCPGCGCKDLIDVSPDVLCSRCDWDSTVWDVSRGGMDNLFVAAKEFGFRVVEPLSGGGNAKPEQMNQPKPEVEGA